MNPIATSSKLISALRLFDTSLFVRSSPSHCDWLVERKWLISLVSFWKWFMDSSLERGSFSPGPKMWGKNEGSRRPRAKLASVTVRGPPVGQKTKQKNKMYYTELLQYRAKGLKSTWPHVHGLRDWPGTAGLVEGLGILVLFLKNWSCTSLEF